MASLNTTSIPLTSCKRFAALQISLALSAKFFSHCCGIFRHPWNSCASTPTNARTSHRRPKAALSANSLISFECQKFVLLVWAVKKYKTCLLLKYFRSNKYVMLQLCTGLVLIKTTHRFLETCSFCYVSMCICICVRTLF